MQALWLLLFLVVTTACAIAQQRDKATNSPGAVQSSPVGSAATNLTPQSPTELGERSTLPDAPSQVAHPASNAVPAVRSPQFFNVETTTAPGASPLVYVGRNSSAASDSGSHLQGNEDRSAAAGLCPRDSGSKADSSWVTSLVSLASKGSHYCALGEGGLWRRGTYAMGRALAAHTNDGLRAFNSPSIFTPGAGAGLQGSYSSYFASGYSAYANQYDGQRLASRYATAIGRDAVKNLLREFMPDVSNCVPRRKP